MGGQGSEPKMELQLEGLLAELQKPNQDPNDVSKVLGGVTLKLTDFGSAASPLLREEGLKGAALFPEGALGDGGAIVKALLSNTTVFTDKPQEMQHTEVGPHPLSGGEMEGGEGAEGHSQGLDHDSHASPHQHYDGMEPEQEHMHKQVHDEPAFRNFQSAMHSAPDWASHAHEGMAHGESEGHER